MINVVSIYFLIVNARLSSTSSSKTYLNYVLWILFQKISNTLNILSCKYAELGTSSYFRFFFF